MAKRGGLGQRLMVGGYNIGGDVGAINSASVSRGVHDNTDIEKSAHTRELLLADGSMSFAAWFDDATEALHDALGGLPTTDQLVLWATGASVGDPALILTGKQINYDWQRAADGSLAGTVDLLNAPRRRSGSNSEMAMVSSSLVPSPLKSSISCSARGS